MIHLTFDYKTDEKCTTPGQYLKYHRTFQGLSTRELAEKVGIVPATLVLYENDRHPIKYKTAVALANALGIDRNRLLDEYTAFVDYSTNNQITGRELLTPDEVRMLDNNLALLFIRGEPPLMDEKYDLLKHPNVKYTTDGGAPVYSHGGTENAVADMAIGRLTPGDLANIQEPETLCELLSDEDMEKIFQFKEEKQNEAVS